MKILNPKKMSFWAVSFLLFLPFLTFAQQKSQPKAKAKRTNSTISFVEKKGENRVEVNAFGKPFTAYFFAPDSVSKKPVLYPIRSAKGTIITRQYPFVKIAGERVDHPHHIGMWLNYESVNGFDFWNNSTAIKDRTRYGTVKHTAFSTATLPDGKGKLTSSADWFDTDGKGRLLLKEETTYFFAANDSQRIIDRVTTLIAQDTTVVFKDVKDGMFAIRVARELEHPSDKPDIFVDANGIETKVDKLDNTNITGSYRSSEGVEGEAVWSTRARWVNLRGRMGNENISLCIFDHPKNLSYPTYWHARGYGLFAANPLGAAVFSKGKETLNFTLAPKERITFRYRTVVTSGKPSDSALNTLATDFATQKY